MIAKIKGRISFIEDNFAVVDVNGIGYKVYVTVYTLSKLVSGTEAEFFTHTYVREDTLALYGFLEFEELQMFELLISISGIGPKAAMSILAIADPKTIRAAVLNDDASVLTRVSGIGKKIAQRVILELKNKVIDMPSHEKTKISADSDALDALIAMGYSVSEGREALKNISSEIKDVGEKVKQALKNLGKRK